MRRLTAGFAGATLFALLGARPAPAAVQLPANFVDQVLTGTLDAPTSMAFLPDGRLLITEQNTGNVRLFVNGHIAATDPVLTVPGIEAFGERGLLGIAVDPRWPVYPFVYVSYTHTGGTQRIVRWLASDDVDVPLGENLSFSAPRILIDDIRDQFPNHNAGCLRFGPDGCLYASLGDDAVFCEAGDSTTLRGEILRLRTSALPIFGGPQVPRALITPPDNPYVASADSNARLVYAFGLRNPFRFHIDPRLGTLYVADVGESSEEEYDEVASGDFLGWPWVEGTIPRGRPECPEPGGDGNRPQRGPIAVIDRGDPIGYAIISAGMYRPVAGASDNWPPEYYPIRGDVFYGQYYAGFLRRLTFDGSQWGPAPPAPGQPNATDWATGMLTSVDFQVGPDGSLWWLQQYDDTFNDQTGTLHRIVWTGPPTAVGPGAAPGLALRVTPNPSAGPCEVTLSLDRDERATVAIFDLAGRRVRELFAGPLSRGVHPMTWDGRDGRGATAGPGVYFARMERAGATAVTERLLRLR